MRDSTIIYRSFYEAILELPSEDQASVWKAIFEYSLNFKEIELTGYAKMVFTLIKPQLEANIKKYKNGQKGGRPPKEDNQERTKLKPNDNQEVTKSKGNENVNSNENINNNDDGNKKQELSIIANTDLFLNNEKRVKAFMTDFKMKDFNVLERRIQDFNNHLGKKNSQEKTVEDYASHFDNWLKKQDPSGMNRSNGSGYNIPTGDYESGKIGNRF